MYLCPLCSPYAEPKRRVVPAQPQETIDQRIAAATKVVESLRKDHEVAEATLTTARQREFEARQDLNEAVKDLESLLQALRRSLPVSVGEHLSTVIAKG